MAFSMEDLHELLRLLDQHPEWKRELRRVLLTDELLELPQAMRQLVEAQRRTEERLEALVQRFDELVDAQRSTEARLEALIRRVDRLADDVAALKGDNLERKFRERVRLLVRRPYRRVQLVSFGDLRDELDEAVDAGLLTEEEAEEVLRADAVVSARGPEGDLLLVVEVSWVVDRHDVERAAHRAVLVGKLGRRVRGAVAGPVLVWEAKLDAEGRGVAVLPMP